MAAFLNAPSSSSSFLPSSSPAKHQKPDSTLKLNPFKQMPNDMCLAVFPRMIAGGELMKIRRTSKFFNELWLEYLTYNRITVGPKSDADTIMEAFSMANSLCRQKEYSTTDQLSIKFEAGDHVINTTGDYEQMIGIPCDFVTLEGVGSKITRLIGELDIEKKNIILKNIGVLNPHGMGVDIWGPVTSVTAIDCEFTATHNSRFCRDVSVTQGSKFTATRCKFSGSNIYASQNPHTIGGGSSGLYLNGRGFATRRYVLRDCKMNCLDVIGGECHMFGEETFVRNQLRNKGNVHCKILIYLPSTHNTFGEPSNNRGKISYVCVP